MTSEVKKKTVSLWLIVVSVTLCCTNVNNFRGTKSLQLCPLGGDFSFAAQLQETWTFVFSRPHTIGKEVGVEMRAEIKRGWESLYGVDLGPAGQSGALFLECSYTLQSQPDNMTECVVKLRMSFTNTCIDFSGVDRLPHSLPHQCGRNLRLSEKQTKKKKICCWRVYCGISLGWRTVTYHGKGI